MLPCYLKNNNNYYYGDGDYNCDNYIIAKNNGDNDAIKTPIPELFKRTDSKGNFSKEKRGGRLT